MKETAEIVYRLHWEAVALESKVDKQRILSAGMGSGGANPGLPDITLTARENQVSRLSVKVTNITDFIFSVELTLI